MPRPIQRPSTGLDAKLQDLDRQLREVKKALKDAARGKAVVVPAAGPPPRPPRFAKDPPRREEPVAPPSPAPAEPEPGKPQAEPDPAPIPPGSRIRPGSSPRPNPYRTPEIPPRTTQPSPARAGMGPQADKQRFASYFSGSFIGGRPMREERRVQRNRAIVMMIVVVIVAYIVYSLVSR